MLEDENKDLLERVAEGDRRDAESSRTIDRLQYEVDARRIQVSKLLDHIFERNTCAEEPRDSVTRSSHR